MTWDAVSNIDTQGLNSHKNLVKQDAREWQNCLENMLNPLLGVESCSLLFQYLFNNKKTLSEIVPFESRHLLL